MFRGTKGIIGKDINIQNIINALEELRFQPELKQIFRDDEGVGDAIITIQDEKDGARELFVLWNYQDLNHICPSPQRTIFNLALWGNSQTIIQMILQHFEGGYLVYNDKKQEWRFITQ